ncbi:carboxylate-amine ligase [Steroidobacter sp.]|uniref:carboxylate-amine ligase n=1 Tax=Steroidobacter sp. TaxID=1978227 RepID=UPI001A3C5D90|nr:carboxylate-amine ligase [Steroidobacter sp.]MBL8269306.1 carboxylate-amine ligase [Steroidobacter sp.]
MASFEHSFGIEEEFFLVDAASGALGTPALDQLMSDARAKLGDIVTSELLQSQIEIASPILHSHDQAREVMSRTRRELSEVVAGHDLQLIAASTHPLGVWQEQLITEKRRYDKLIADFRIVTQRNLVCGLHIHVAIPEHVDRVDVMNRAMHWLPVFLALSTSSPFWNHRVTGLLSYRQALYDEWPRSGIPDFFRDEADYQAFASRMQAAGAITDSSQLWWAIRPALRFPTLEMRIADVCTRLDDALAIAALYRCLVATLVANPDMGKVHSTHTRRLIDENRWRAKRDGTKAEFILETSNEVVPVATVVKDLLSACADQIDRLDCTTALKPIERILNEGTSAHQQLKIYNDSRAAGDEGLAALSKVIDWLRATTLEVAS